MGVQKLNTIYIYNVFDDCVEWADDFFGLGLTINDQLLTKT